MKLIELQAYRTFMFAIVPQLYLAQKPSLRNPKDAIEEAQYLWDVIDGHVLEVAEKLEND